MRPKAFADKLALVLKSFVLSRTGLASALNVDKSLVGRWVAGSVMPSEHNLARLTRYIAERVDGFTLLDWERDMAGFAQLLGVEAMTPGDGLPGASMFPGDMLEEGLRGARLRGAAYDGFWRTTRASSDLPGRFLNDITMIYRRKDGLIGFRTGVEGARFEGWALLLQNQFFSIGWDAEHGSLLFGIYNGVARQRAEMLDGISLATLRDAGGSPAASVCVMQRIGDITGDMTADMQRFEAEVADLVPIAPEDSVPEDIRAHLERSREGDHPGMLRLLFATSMARGQVLSATEYTS